MRAAATLLHETGPIGGPRNTDLVYLGYLWEDLVRTALHVIS